MTDYTKMTQEAFCRYMLEIAEEIEVAGLPKVTGDNLVTKTFNGNMYAG